MASFGVARVVVAVQEIAGWTILVGGLVLAFVVSQTANLLQASWIAGGAVTLGLTFVALAQLVRAQIVTAESSQEMVALMRAQRPQQSPVGGAKLLNPNYGQRIEPAVKSAME